MHKRNTYLSLLLGALVLAAVGYATASAHTPTDGPYKTLCVVDRSITQGIAQLGEDLTKRLENCVAGTIALSSHSLPPDTSIVTACCSVPQ